MRLPLLLLLLLSVVLGESGPPVVLPVCPPGHQGGSADSTLVLVSTLDGRVQALDALNFGRLLWSLPTGTGPLLRSTISELDVSASGQFLRLIPSLSGALYKFDGSSVEQLPFDADALLRSSSFRLADSTIVAGGKENLVYAVNARSGRLVYTCGIQGCSKRSDDEESDKEDVIVVHLETQTVKAVDARSGVEKWNFSVANHAIEYHVSDLCPPSNRDTLFTSKSTYKASMAEGLIRSFENGRAVWSHRFDSPIADAWRVDASGQLHRLDVFGNDDEHERPPSLYLGVHGDQYYIQENPFDPNPINPLILNTLENSAQWRPYLISASSRTPVYNLDAPRLTQEKKGPITSGNDGDSHALAVRLPSGYPFDTGLYLYAENKGQLVNLLDEEHEEKENATGLLLSDNITKENKDGRQIPETQESKETVVQFVIVGMGFWWREIVLISLSTALFFNLIFFRPYLRRLKINFQMRINDIQNSIPKPSVVVVEVPVQVAMSAEPLNKQQMSSPSTHSSGDSWVWPKAPSQDDNFVSRFLTDFEPLRCLGKGGFGVVFEARHCLDDTHYAVKRIRLPSNEHQRRKMMREVKGLAKLDHKNIVRYFNTWLEQPPAGWQEERDEWWKLSNMAFSATHTLASTTESENVDTNAIGVRALDRTNRKESNEICDESFGIVFEKDGNSKNGIDKSIDETNSNIETESDEDESNIPNCVYNPEKEDSSFGIVFENGNSKYEGNTTSSSNKASSATTTSNDKSSTDCKEALNLLDSQMSSSSPDEDEWLPLTENKTSKKPPVYLYIVMQLCQDTSLRDWLRSHQIDRDLGLARDVFKQICLGVAYVHREGLIHRDLKPSNIFFAADGAVKIGDFGLVTHKHDTSDDNEEQPRAEITESRLKELSLMHTDRVGTELYMSPEQLQGLRYDHKVDVYSMGLILVELLVPFETQMERVRSLGELRRNSFPQVFKEMPEMPIAKAMLNNKPQMRPEVSEVLAKLNSL